MFCFLIYNGSHSQYTTSRYNRTIQNLDYQSIVYITDKCEYVSVQNQQNVVLRVCGNNYLLPFVFFFSFFLMCMAVWKRVCVWLILYIWCLKWKNRQMSWFWFSFYLFFLEYLQLFLWVLRLLYMWEWFSDCWMWLCWGRSSMDWLLYGLI